jgi:hypothetical protein
METPSQLAAASCDSSDDLAPSESRSGSLAFAPCVRSTEQRSTETASVALAWILRKDVDLVPLVGMGRPVTHSAGKTATGWCVVDVWESEAHFGKFRETRLGPAFAKVGGIPEPKVTTFQVYNRFPK